MGVSASERRNRQAGSSKPSGTTPSRQQREYTHRFARLELTADQKAEFRALLEAGELDSVSCDDFLRLGYSVKFTGQDSGKTCLCTITCSIEGDPNYGLMLTGRAGDSITALRVAAYKDVYLCDNGMWASGESAARERGDDIG